MRVWVYQSSAGSDKINYLHVFEGERQGNGYVEIVNNLICFGKKGGKQNFQKPGEQIMTNWSAEYSDIKQAIIEAMFTDKLDVEKSEFYDV